ncbi:receptor-type tyrosine-protein phosphatase-like ida-1 isoform X3 [Vespa mandarinia]|uniref:receptor-type tyrosine-protein phosphatase-like ida-1 isoform X3 n=1 Tax=Vespa mandarinia TaxID=7446 RepID=UPI00160D46DC|nr:receptor-type tyrosine-protein phosphatase-like ida-1 isoform X3 [Vespa mandarinia]
MGYKNFWHGGLGLLLLCILHHDILADGDIGCRFNIDLCDSQTEVCYDDLAFGKCIPLYSNFEEDDLYQYKLDTEELNVLRLQLQRLEIEGYKWSHPYTQCILRTSLDNFRHRLTQDLRNCQYLMRKNRYRLKDEDIVEDKDKQTVPFAIVKFTPNDGNSYGEFANEIYYPPGSRDESTRLFPNDKEFLDLPKNDPESEHMRQLYKLTYGSDPYDKYSLINDEDFYKRKLHKKSLTLNEVKAQIYQSQPYRSNSKIRDTAGFEILKDALNGDSPIRKLNGDMNFQETKMKSKDNMDVLHNDKFVFDESYDDNFDIIPEEDYEKTFSRKYKQHPTVSAIEFLNEEPLWRDNIKRHINIDKNLDYLNKNLARIRMDLRKGEDVDLPDEDALFTEGGMVQSLRQATDTGGETPYGIHVDDLNALLLRRELSGFKRRERLDVKKPGPLFSTNNHIFKMQTPIAQKDSMIETTTEQEDDDNAKLPATLEVPNDIEMSSTLFGAIVAAGIAAAITAAVVTLVIVRRHAKSREKLAGLATPDPEASKDYQDLCRVRMQAKQPTEKQEPWRLSSSRENEGNNFVPDRSSTSSWTEEPAFSSMDISTGHMVLSYMEDHLKNKDRLDQEWAALCSYGSTSNDVVENNTNSKYNRPNAPLPYNHSRIVLNELTNANNSDYINASTIKSTDHDPRNPAYIATQGPLPQTAADFWQLVWEQGSVVIVALTRLTEDGRSMCYRYWPDQAEGSERYHIYEVHLVSEHPWCDDYLVRSFYLKNLLTSETRTVTQFHFLSWPENGVPHSTKALLEFRRKINKSYRGRSCPIVVHCSDGAGRTGTYCLIDMVLNRIAKGTKEIDIAAALEHIRDQRPNMVATKQQFEFVLMAVAEEVHAILKALSIPSNEKLTTTGNGSSSPTKSDQ